MGVRPESYVSTTSRVMSDRGPRPRLPGDHDDSRLPSPKRLVLYCSSPPWSPFRGSLVPESPHGFRTVILSSRIPRPTRTVSSHHI